MWLGRGAIGGSFTCVPDMPCCGGYYAVDAFPDVREAWGIGRSRDAELRRGALPGLLCRARKRVGPTSLAPGLWCWGILSVDAVESLQRVDLTQS